MKAERIKVVKDWPEPKSVPNIQVFLGFANFYCRFNQGFSKIVALLILLIKTTGSLNKPVLNRNNGSMPASSKNNGSKPASSKNDSSKLASNRNDSSKPTSNRNNGNRSASSRNDGSNLASGKNDNNIQVD